MGNYYSVSASEWKLVESKSGDLEQQARQFSEPLTTNSSLALQTAASLLISWLVSKNNDKGTKNHDMLSTEICGLSGK